MTNEEKIQGLRGLADLWEANPELCEAVNSEPAMYALITADVQKFARLALLLGNADKGVEGSFYNVSRQFGLIKFEVTSLRDWVCTKTVVGTEEVTTMAPDPELVAALPLVEQVKVVEKVEWVCPPSLHELAKESSHD